MHLRPLHDWALIECSDAGDMTAGGIIIPDSAREKPAEGIVVAIGPGKFKLEKGKEKKKKKVFVPTSVVPGQRVVYARYMSTEIELDGNVLILVREEDILCTVETPEKPVAKSIPRDVLVPMAPDTTEKRTSHKARVSARPSGKRKTSPRPKKKVKKKDAKGKKAIKKTVGTATKKTAKKAIKKTTKKKAMKKKPERKTVSKKKAVKTIKKPSRAKKVKKKKK